MVILGGWVFLTSEVPPYNLNPKPQTPNVTGRGRGGRGDPPPGARYTLAFEKEGQLTPFPPFLTPFTLHLTPLNVTGRGRGGRGDPPYGARERSRGRAGRQGTP